MSRKDAADLISAKDEEICWLKEEIKYLRREVGQLLEIVEKR
jgi:hypothetical protein